MHLKRAAEEINADILCTSSRRTPKSIEQILYRELKKEAQCPLLIVANQTNIAEAVGGMLALADINIVSGDSISMISEAASSGKNTIVFYPELKPGASAKNVKQFEFIKNLDKNGFIYACNIKDLERSVYDVAKGKIQTKRLDDQAIILEAVRYVI
jgi:mitochondrial fission protein ELM1